MIRVGLTGSIAMGKSTTAEMFRAEGVPVHDADAVVHRLYAPGGAAVSEIARLAPEAVVAGGVDRERLKAAIRAGAVSLAEIEAAVHPLVEADRRAFDAEADASGADLVVYDIPLLYETGGDVLVDAVVVVTAPPEVQRTRVLSRPGMTNEALDIILARQTPDAEKRARADIVIDTSRGRDAARANVRAALKMLRERFSQGNARPGDQSDA